MAVQDLARAVVRAAFWTARPAAATIKSPQKSGTTRMPRLLNMKDEDMSPRRTTNMVTNKQVSA